MSNFLNIATMAGGVAFFLFGMSILGNGLEKLSGGKMEKTLEKITNNIFKSLFLGMLVTAAIQSSSATTVIVVGLVNAGILKLRNAIGVIMGANIGTTVTSIILSFTEIGDIPGAGALLQLLKPKAFTPFIAVIGIIIFMTAKNGRRKMVGEIMLGFGILFNGMFIMTDAVEPLADSPLFQTLFSTLSNPILGILAGTIVTALIQSSSASIGILQAVASTGAVRFSAALPIIMGQNIGTCVTSLISSVGANKNARRAAMVHLYFNVIGTVLFCAAVYLIQALVGFPFWDEPIGMAGISGAHIIFNVVTTLIFIPFTGLLEKLAVLTVREKKIGGEDDEEAEIVSLDKRFLRTPSLALSHCRDAIIKMGEYSRKNFARSVQMFSSYDSKRREKIMEYEEAIDRIEGKVNDYLLELTNEELSEEESREITFQLKLVIEFERIGDYAVNVLELAEKLHEQQASLSERALSDLSAISDAVSEIIDMALSSFQSNNVELATRVEPLEETVDGMEDTLKYRHIERLKNGKCTIDGGLVFLELLTYLERISDHCSNIAVHIIGYHSHKDFLDRHEYLKRLHNSSTGNYSRLSEYYMKKYYSRIQRENSTQALPDSQPGPEAEA